MAEVFKLYELMKTRFIHDNLDSALRSALTAMPNGSTIDLASCKFGRISQLNILELRAKYHFINSINGYENSLLAHNEKAVPATITKVIDLNNVPTDLNSFLKFIASELNETESYTFMPSRTGILDFVQKLAIVITRPEVQLVFDRGFYDAALFPFIRMYCPPDNTEEDFLYLYDGLPIRAVPNEFGQVYIYGVGLVYVRDFVRDYKCISGKIGRVCLFGDTKYDVLFKNIEQKFEEHIDENVLLMKDFIEEGWKS